MNAVHRHHRRHSVVRTTLLASLLAAIVSLASLSDALGQDASTLSPAEQQALKESIARYAAQRGDGPVIARTAVSERLLARTPVTIVDVREAPEYAHWHVEGARSLPLSQIVAAGGQIADLPRGAEVVVVHTNALSAMEAAVVLRLAGYQAFAMSEGLGTLAQDLTRKAEGERLLAGADAAREAAAETAREQAAAADPNQQTIIMALGAVTAVSLLAGLGVLLYFQVWQPRRRRRPMLEAFEIIQADRQSEFERADMLLAQALTAGLKAGDIAEARFALAYVRARRGEYADASTVVEELMKEKDESPETLYLDLWLLVNQKRYEPAVSRFERHGSSLGGLFQSKLLFAIALLEQGRILLGRRQTGEALALFRSLRALGELKDKIPEDIDDQDIAVGIDALFQHDLAGAQRHFSSALQAAETASRSTLHAQLGLLLCRWRAEERPDIDAALTALIAGAATELGLDRLPPALADSATDEPAPQIVTLTRVVDTAPDQIEDGVVIDAPNGTGTAATGDAADDLHLDLLPMRGSQPTLDAPLLRGVLLWHAISLVTTWLKLPARGGGPADAFDELVERLSLVRRADPTMGDPSLIEGLLRYYLSPTHAGRQAAIAMLNAAPDVSLPEVVYLLERERKLAARAADARTPYLQAVKQFVQDESVPSEMRDDLQEFITARGVDLADVTVENSVVTMGPLREFEQNIKMSIDRVGRIAVYGMPDIEPAAQEQLKAGMKELDEASQALAETAKATYRAYVWTLKVMGERLLPEEQQSEPPSSSVAQIVADTGPAADER